MRLLLKVVLLYFISLGLEVVGAKTCEITFVEAFSLACGARGWVRDPSVLLVMKDTPAVKQCASSCLDKDRCMSFRYIDEKSTCILYSDHLWNMLTDYAYDPNYQSGRLFDRKCFTRNCDIIAACNAVKGCPEIYGIQTYWDYYACSYGHTARKYKYDYRTVLLNGSFSACKAMKHCGVGHGSGSLDLHWLKSKKKWQCIRFQDQLSDPYYPSMDDQRVDHTRYSVRNSTIGAGYGYYMSFYNYD